MELKAPVVSSSRGKEQGLLPSMARRLFEHRRSGSAWEGPCPGRSSVAGHVVYTAVMIGDSRARKTGYVPGGFAPQPSDKNHTVENTGRRGQIACKVAWYKIRLVKMRAHAAKSLEAMTENPYMDR